MCWQSRPDPINYKTKYAESRKIHLADLRDIFIAIYFSDVKIHRQLHSNDMIIRANDIKKCGANEIDFFLRFRWFFPPQSRFHAHIATFIFGTPIVIFLAYAFFFLFYIYFFLLFTSWCFYKHFGFRRMCVCVSVCRIGTEFASRKLTVNILAVYFGLLSYLLKIFRVFFSVGFNFYLICE